MAELRSSSPLTWLIDPFRATKDDVDATYTFSGGQLSYLAPLGLGVALLIIGAVGWTVDHHLFFFSYLIGWTFCVTLALGALFFTLIHHITKAHWGTVVRRIPEAMTWTFPILAVLAIPIILGMHDLYHWTHAELYDPADSHYDEILVGKQAYLNTPFWLARMAIYFLIWTFISYRLLKLSIQQDVAPNEDIPIKQRRISAWGIPVFAVTTAFASYDILMALDPHWFSTIFGVYFFAGCFFSANAMIVILARLVQKQGNPLTGVVTVEHYHDLGKWMLAMTAFWTYIAFSQYMLYWYGGIPEETVFYRHRFEHGWEWHSYALMAFHFIVPFCILLIRQVKRVPGLLSIMAGYFMVIHFFDLHWIAIPIHDQLNDVAHASISWISVACWLGFLFLFIGMTMYRLTRHSLVAYNDPRYAKSVHHQNV